MIFRRSRAALLAASILSIPVAMSPVMVQPASAQWIVYDPTNYVQNVLSAARALEQMADVLDPQCGLPVALCGSVGQQLQPKMSAALQNRCVVPAQDASLGALALAFKFLELSQ